MTPLEALGDDLEAQRAFVLERAPVYARALEILAREIESDFGDRLAEAWKERTFRAWYERPLLILAALRDDALRVGRAHPLYRAIAAEDPDPDAVTEAAVGDALGADRDHLWRTLRERALQTNESSRAVAWLWPAQIAAEVAPDRPVALVDVGASAGLNLVADALPPIWQSEEGRPLDVAPLPPIAARIGYDARPLDALDQSDARWLRACVWPGQQERLARLERAIAAFRARQNGPDAPAVHRTRAAEVPELLPRQEDQLALVYQTIVRDYLGDEERTAYTERMHRWLASRPPGSALWLELEVTPAARHGGPPAAITAHLAAGSLELAHCEPHPRTLTINQAAVTELRQQLVPSA